MVAVIPVVPVVAGVVAKRWWRWLWWGGGGGGEGGGDPRSSLQQTAWPAMLTIATRARTPIWLL